MNIREMDLHYARGALGSVYKTLDDLLDMDLPELIKGRVEEIKSRLNDLAELIWEELGQPSIAQQ